MLGRHEQLAELALARDADAGTAAIQGHIGQTAKALLDLLEPG